MKNKAGNSVYIFYVLTHGDFVTNEQFLTNRKTARLFGSKLV